MKTVRKCFLAMVSTVSMTVAASGVMAQSLPAGQSFNFQNEASNSQIGSPSIYGTAPARDANPRAPDPRASEFTPHGDLPFNAIRQQFTPASRDGRPPVVRAPGPAAVQASRNTPTGESFAVPQNGQPAPVVGVPAQQQISQPAARVASNGPPLAYMASAPYGLPPTQQAANYPGPGMASPHGLYPNPAMGLPQGPYPGQGMGMGMPQGPNPGPGMGFSQGPPPPNNFAMAAAYGTPQAFSPGAGGIAGPAGKPAGQSFCGSCDGSGCANCGYGRGFGTGGGFLAGALRRLLPYGEGGQCAPRWYDITLDAMYMARDDVSRRIDFTADGPGPGPTIIMSTDDLKFEEQVGLRFNAALQVFATATAEFTYYGLFDWSSSASRADAMGGLYSPISQFATFPPLGFSQTDNAISHSIAYSSTIDNFELNFRRRFTAPNCRVQASIMAGVRYFYLLEEFRYFTEGLDLDLVTPGNQAGTMDYNIRARNSLTGFQIGGDLWSSIIPGIKAGGEIKAGAYGNYGNQTTSIVVTEPSASFLENVDANDIALIADANMMVIWRVNPNWTIRVGYQVLYLDGVILAPEQFNGNAPPNLVNPSLRLSTKNDNGKALYHGGFAGLEWMW